MWGSLYTDYIGFRKTNLSFFVQKTGITKSNDYTKEIIKTICSVAK